MHISNQFKNDVMKTRSRIIVASGAIVCALLGGTAIAATTPIGNPETPVHSGYSSPKSIQVQVKQLVNSEIVRVTVDNPEARRITVILTDLSGTTINRIVGGKNEKEVVRDFNFEQAEDGTYQLEVYDGQNTVKKEIHLQRVPQPDITKLSIQ
jgi:hypothetical protein